MLTVWTQVDGIAVGGLTTAQHLLHHFVDGFILRMGPFEVRPPIDKDVLEAVLLLATIWCHLPECRPPSSGCQSAAGVTGRKKEIPMGSSYRDKKYQSIIGEDRHIDVVYGRARLLDPHTVAVDGPEGVTQLRGDKILVALGSSPTLPSIEGLDQTPYLTSDLLTSQEELELKELPT